MVSLEKDTENLIRRVVNNIVNAYRAIEKELGVSISIDIVENALREVEHLAIHELCHAALNSLYPRIE
ncbi:MAG TPA: hypothetical protein ENF93_02150, partial [Ignisphaera sp.]|nr:hypothetical protein [Ignisphaera sp.]